MKKFLVFLLLLVLGFSLVGCKKGDTKVQKAVEAASKMTEKELLEAAKKEIGDGTFVVETQASGVAKALAKFTEKYGIKHDSERAKSAKKDAQLYEALGVVYSNQYYADMVVIQDARQLAQIISEKIIYKYIPNQNEIKLDKDDLDPLATVYYNRLFLYNKKDTSFTIKNVWQLAGKEGESGHISDFSMQRPVNDNINMNFLLSLTSKEGIERLTKAYKAFYGKDYEEDPKYPNIAYKYISELIGNVSVWHDSDTTAVKSVLPQDTKPSRTVFFSAFAKYKNLVKEKGADVAKEVFGWEHEMEGFKGFLYKMYSVVPKTAKYPYTACLFARYLLTEEGFNSAFGDQYGYYSPNASILPKEGDKPLSYWKKVCLIEDGNYLASLKQEVANYIKSRVTGGGK